ncbi:MAG: DNA primase [Lachnospiraceae bacterium]|nr:DNA primase [Lachnospiraceae bacterium]MDD3795010.1 DNA primase [Lachnospiraceae bacterium]
MYYPEDLIEEVRTKNDIVDVISGYVKLQRKGSSYFGLCPFHNEKSPSFSVSPSKQMYYCFGCGAGGNIITFIMEYENYSFPEALRFLADRVGMDLPEQEYSKEARAQQDLRASILEVNKIAAKYYYYQLRTSAGAQGMEYLRARQLSEDTMRQFGLGYAGKFSDGLYHYLKQKGIGDELLHQSGLMNVDEKRGMYDKFWNRVIFPIMDVNNRVIGFGGRVMGDGKPKYLNSPETKVFDKSRNLYGLNIARTSRKKKIIVCEGYMDVIAMHQAGFNNAVASLGTALTSQHASLLKRYTDEVILSYDSDEAGVKAALRAIPMMKEAGIRARVLHLEPYKDPDEFMKALGAEAFQERLDQAQNSFLFELSILEKQHDMQDPESKTAFFKEAAKKISEFELEVERENYIEAVAEQYHTSFEGLRKMVLRCLMQGLPAKPEVVRTRRNTEKDDGLKKSQRMLLTWLTEYKSFYAVLKPYIGPEDFTNDFYRKVAGILFAQLEEGTLNPARIIDCFTDAEEQRQAAELFHTMVPVEKEEEMKKAMKETIGKVMEASLEQRSATMDPADMGALQQVIEGKRRLQELQKLHISLE